MSYAEATQSFLLSAKGSSDKGANHTAYLYAETPRVLIGGESSPHSCASYRPSPDKGRSSYVYRWREVLVRLRLQLRPAQMGANPFLQCCVGLAMPVG